MDPLRTMPRRRWPHCASMRWLLGAAICSVIALGASPSSADRLTIKRPGDHPDYFLEIEPHLNVSLIDPPGIASGKGIGAGARATLELVDNGFVSTINNTIGLGLGLDYVRAGIEDRDRRCIESAPDPADPRDEICLAFDSGESADYFLIPVVMQWNFWLSEQWSVFGEPGALLYVVDYGGEKNDFEVDVCMYAGGRWHFTSGAALTLRLGYPTFSVGASFLL